MTPKTKVLKILDKYRDKELTMGCRVIAKVDHWQKECTFIRGTEKWCVVLPDNGDEWGCNKIKVIIGHPITHADLLLALHKEVYDLKYDMPVKRGGAKHMLIYDMKKVFLFAIPLTYRTIEDIPEEDKMWQAVLDVLI